jgi:hypothetical protein
MAKRLVSANGRPLGALALLGVLCACAATPAAPRPEAPAAGWRIVERVGQARYLAPDAAAWVSATIGEALADGSEVATGRGGRLIIDAPGRHISAGPDSRFVLPDGDRDDRLDQRAGWLRYRVAEAAAQPFRIHTRSLELELLVGVVDVHVNHRATEVTVKEGEVRVATPDGLRQTQMIAGQSAHAGSDDVQLAVRLQPGAPLQPVDRVIVPALHPKPSPPKTPPANAPAATLPTLSPGDTSGAPPSGPAVGHAPPVPPPADTTLEARPYAAARVPIEPMGTADHASGVEVSATRSEPEQPRASETAAAALRRGQFERLTAGMLDQVEASTVRVRR